MFAAKSLTMERRSAKESRQLGASPRSDGATNDQMCQFALSVAAEGFILFKFVWGREGYRTSPRMSLIASMFGRAMARAFSAPSARTLFV